MAFVGSMSIIFFLVLIVHDSHKDLILSVGGICWGYILLELGAWTQRLQDSEKNDTSKVDL